MTMWSAQPFSQTPAQNGNSLLCSSITLHAAAHAAAEYAPRTGV